MSIVLATPLHAVRAVLRALLPALLLSLLLSLLAVFALPVAAQPPPRVTVAPEPGGAPWWKRATLHPSGAQVRGLPLARIESSWCAADELGAEAFGDRLAGAGAASPLRDLRFALEAPLEGRARLQTAVLGAYRRCSGEQGLFVLIVEPRADRPRFRYLLEAPDPGTALAGLRFDAARRQLVVHWCGLACDTESRIAWDERTGRYLRVDGEGPVRLQ